jgi:hypothetical protein
MDNYDVIIERTVRDLFKSSPLIQIKKFKFNKEKEIEKKDEDLRTLILEKYPTLVTSISSLEMIDSSLNELQQVRANFLEQVKQIEKVLVKSNEIDFEKLLCFDESCIEKEEINNISCPTFEDSIDEFWNMLNSGNDILEILIKVHSLKRKFNKDSENLDFFLSQLMENAMKIFINLNLREDVDYEKYIIVFLGVYLNIHDEENLLLSEFFLKLNNDVSLNRTFTDVFIFKNIENMNNFNELQKKGYKSIELLIKLLILKLSNYLNLLSETLNETKLIENIINLYVLSSFIINIISNSTHADVTTNIDQDSFSDEEIIQEIPRNTYYSNWINLNLYKVFERCKIIFSVENSEFLFELEENVTRGFSDFLKNQIETNFRLNDTNPKNLLNLWIKIFTDKIVVEKYEYFTKGINSETYDNFISYLFLDISIKQFDECLRIFLKGFEKNNYSSKNSYHLIDLLSLIEGSLKYDSQFSKKILKVLELNLQTFLTMVERENNPTYLNYIISVFQNKIVVKYLKIFNFEDCLNVSKKLAKLFLDNLYKELENYSYTLENFLSIENFSEESCYFNKNEINTDSINEVLNWLNEKFKLEDLEFDFEDYTYEKLKLKILEEITKTYLKVVKSVGIHNKRIAEDLKIFLYIFEKTRHENFSCLVQEVKELLIELKVNNDIENNKMESFINYFIPEKDSNMSSTGIEPKSLNLNFNKKHSTNLDLISFHPRLNVFMLKKMTVQKSQSNSSTLNSNTTSKLLELRIDDNYVSTKSQNVVKTETSKTYDVKLNTAKSNRDISQANITDYLGYFGGKLKENLSNITGLINTP